MYGPIPRPALSYPSADLRPRSGERRDASSFSRPPASIVSAKTSRCNRLVTSVARGTPMAFRQRTDAKQWHTPSAGDRLATLPLDRPNQTAAEDGGKVAIRPAQRPRDRRVRDCDHLDLATKCAPGASDYFALASTRPTCIGFHGRPRRVVWPSVFSLSAIAYRLARRGRLCQRPASAPSWADRIESGRRFPWRPPDKADGVE